MVQAHTSALADAHTCVSVRHIGSQFSVYGELVSNTTLSLYVLQKAV